MEQISSLDDATTAFLVLIYTKVRMDCAYTIYE